MTNRVVACHGEALVGGGRPRRGGKATRRPRAAQMKRRRQGGETRHPHHGERRIISRERCAASSAGRSRPHQFWWSGRPRRTVREGARRAHLGAGRTRGRRTRRHGVVAAQWPSMGQTRSGPQRGKQVLCSPQCLRYRDDAPRRAPRCVVREPGRRPAAAHGAGRVITVFGHG